MTEMYRNQSHMVYSGARTMNVFQNRHGLYNIVAIIGITVVMGYFVVQHNLPGKTEPVKFVNLTNADIQKIMSVKAQMQEAQIQANSLSDIEN